MNIWEEEAKVASFCTLVNQLQSFVHPVNTCSRTSRSLCHPLILTLEWRLCHSHELEALSPWHICTHVNQGLHLLIQVWYFYFLWPDSKYTGLVTNSPCNWVSCLHPFGIGISGLLHSIWSVRCSALSLGFLCLLGKHFNPWAVSLAFKCAFWL